MLNRQTTAKGSEDGECFPELGRRFSRLKFNKKAQPDARRGGKLILPQTLGATRLSDSLSDLSWRHNYLPDRESMLAGT